MKRQRQKSSNLKVVLVILSIVVGIFVLSSIVKLATSKDSSGNSKNDIDKDLRWLDVTTTIVSACVTIFLFAPFLCFAIAAFFKFRSFEHIYEMEFRGNKRTSKTKTKIRENATFSLLNQNDETKLSSPQEEEEEGTKKNASNEKDFVISFLNLSFWVPIESWVHRTQRCVRNFVSCRKKSKDTKGYFQLLHNVSGVFECGMTHVIFGPSGSGKTTLLNLISGRTRHGIYSGVRMINGVAHSDQTYRTELKTVGYVTQRDEFLSELTILETLVFGAMLRVKNDDVTFRLNRVREVLKQVDLWQSRHKHVGGSTIGSGGISGGQRRRLSIALELLTDSKLLLLDEPTSGLDAAASLKVVQLLQRLSRSGKAVVTTIHQPRTEIFQLFDSLFLLKGGSLIFQGTAKRAATFLASSEHVSNEIQLSSYSNPGDFLIDVLGLDAKVDEDNDDDDDDKDEQYPVGIALSREYHQSTFHKEALMKIERLVMNSSNETSQAIAQSSSSGIRDFWLRSWILYGRRLKLSLAAPKEAIAIYAQCLIVTMIIAMAFSYDPDNYISDAPYQNVSVLMFVSSFLCVLTYISNVPEIFSERAILRKERIADYYSFSHYIFSNVLHDVPRAVSYSLLGVFVTYSMCNLNPVSSYVYFLIVAIATGCVAFQSVVALCTAFTDKIGVSYSLIFLILGCGFLFNGVAIRYEDISWIFHWAYFFTPPALLTRAVIDNELHCCHLDMSCQDVRDFVQNIAETSKVSQAYVRAFLLQNANLTHQIQHEHEDDVRPYMECDTVVIPPDANSAGSLGRFVLANLNFHTFFSGPYGLKFESLAFLILVAILSRLLAVVVFEILEHASYRMVPLKRSGSEQCGSLEKSTFENPNEFIAHHVRVSARGILFRHKENVLEENSAGTGKNNNSGAVVATSQRRDVIDVEMV